MKYSLVDFLSLKKNLKPNTEITIISGSMSPWIKTNESVRLSPCKLDDLKKFDIITYWSSVNEVFICHIFTEYRNKEIITKPLSTNDEDTPFDPKYILGKVIKPQFRWYHKILLNFFY